MNSATWHIAGQFVMHQILTTVNDMNGLYSKSILKTTATNMHHIVEMLQTSSFVHTGDHFTQAIQFATPRLFDNHLMSAVKYHTQKCTSALANNLSTPVINLKLPLQQWSPCV